MNLCKKQVNLDLRALYKWLLDNKILPNFSKTELITFEKAGSEQKYILKRKLKSPSTIPSDSIEYLGIKLDLSLSGSEHLSLSLLKAQKA